MAVGWTKHTPVTVKVWGSNAIVIDHYYYIEHFKIKFQPYNICIFTFWNTINLMQCDCLAILHPNHHYRSIDMWNVHKHQHGTIMGHIPDVLGKHIQFYTFGGNIHKMPCVSLSHLYPINYITASLFWTLIS